MSRQKFQDCVVRFVKDEDGATAIEYGLLAALISVGIATVAGTVGTQLIAVFTSINTSLQSAITPPAGGGS